MMLGQDLLTELGLNFKFSEHVIEENDETFKGYTTPMGNLGTYIFKYLNIGKITHEELFSNGYVEEVYEPEHVFTATKQVHLVLYAKYDKANLHNVIKT